MYDLHVYTWVSADPDEPGSVQWPSLGDLADAWWQSYRAQPYEFSPSHELVSDLLEAPSAEAVYVLHAIVARANSDEELAFVGAGPLEDVLSHNGHGQNYIDDIIDASNRDPRFRTALSNVYVGKNANERVRALLTGISRWL